MGTTYSLEPARERLALIHRIKEHQMPPCRVEDLYDVGRKYPWKKLGGLYYGMESRVGWFWFDDIDILRGATKEDLEAALARLEDRKIV